MSEQQQEQSHRATVTIQNRLGLHARPAMAFVDLASRYRSRITVRKGDQAVDGKSIMQMMMLAAGQGCQLEVEVAGPDAAEALEELKELVDRKFDEE